MSEQWTLEEKFKELDRMIEQLQDENISLEESIRIYSEGMKAVAACNEKIEEINGKLVNLKEAEDEVQ
ncbi:MAG: exodeoxyribonuclease VII small subunit [Eubacteriales bacterium]|nr:exodeoxyribonuclease VII small subunit [Eubacteriales bacterium]